MMNTLYWYKNIYIIILITCFLSFEYLTFALLTYVPSFCDFLISMRERFQTHTREAHTISAKFAKRFNKNRTQERGEDVGA